MTATLDDVQASQPAYVLLRRHARAIDAKLARCASRGDLPDGEEENEPAA
jgi:hypothetical protein